MTLEIEVVSASAGSGKTTHIAKTLLDAVQSKAARPEAVIATTFTNKAAAELVERVRTRLFASGLSTEAHRLAGARLGTVNSVCGRLVSDFAFELGLSPELTVLDEVLAQQALNRAVDTVITTEEAEAFDRIRSVFREFDRNDALRQLIATARNNRISAEQFAADAQRSIDSLLGYFPKPTRKAETLNEALRKALAEFVDGVDTENDKTKGTRDSLALCNLALKPLAEGRLPWSDWLKLLKNGPTKKSAELYEPVLAAAAKVTAHPALHADLRQAIELVFTVAGRAMEAYAREKQSWGAIDFVDQEVLALELLDRADVRESLEGEIDLLLVDEFQDTSPIQLALFSKLASLAKRTVWVGDQKQAIYGFRGADPALMDLAIEHVLQGQEPQVLDKSYRSRPGLVELTSELFARAFEGQKIPAIRTRLTASLTKEPAGLGPVIEHWQLEHDHTNASKAGALAAAVKQLVEDSVRVRNRSDGAVRALRPGDVAVLCRTHDVCEQVADALSGLGVKASVARSGLLSTLEARAALSALKLLIDERDSLAAAELARILEHPDEPNEWLDAVLAERGKAPVFDSLAFHKVLGEARTRHELEGPLVALDAAMEAIEVRELCLRWGDSPTRLANLDALRQMASQYLDTCRAEGRGATSVGLVSYLEQQQAAGDDRQAMVTGDEAVSVQTWHAAKGLEWPVVVLANLDHPDKFGVFGVRVDRPDEPLSFENPLQGRRLRYWPNPFWANQTGAEPLKSLMEGAEATRAKEENTRQELRLLYVGWTRARDRLVLPGRGATLPFGHLGLLRDEDGPLLSPGDEKGQAEWAGVAVKLGLREAEAGAPETPEPAPDKGPSVKRGREHPPAWVTPSSLSAVGRVVRVVDIGPRAKLKGRVDMNQLGSAVHLFLGADVVELSAGDRLALASRALRQWDVAGALEATELVRMGDALRAWVTATVPAAVWHREVPMFARDGDGSIIRGIADLVLEEANGFHIVDHKSFPGTDEEALKRAAAYSGQLEAYCRVWGSIGPKARGHSWIHLPLLGKAVMVSRL